MYSFINKDVYVPGTELGVGRWWWTHQTTALLSRSWPSSRQRHNTHNQENQSVINIPECRQHLKNGEIEGLWYRAIYVYYVSVFISFPLGWLEGRTLWGGKLLTEMWVTGSRSYYKMFVLNALNGDFSSPMEGAPIFKTEVQWKIDWRFFLSLLVAISK